jgi:hypothetical protein
MPPPRSYHLCPDTCSDRPTLVLPLCVPKPKSAPSPLQNHHIKQGFIKQDSSSLNYTLVLSEGNPAYMSLPSHVELNSVITILHHHVCIVNCFL